MGRVAVLAVRVVVLLFFLVACDANSSVATCGLASALQTSGERLEQQVQDVASATQRSLEGQRGQVEGPQGDVAALQGNDSVLRPPFGQVAPGFLLPVCEVYTVSEAMEWARFGFRDENPNVHFVHIPCGDSCPPIYLTYLPGCYRPNGDPGMFVSPLYNCLTFDGPVLDGRRCTRTVFISNGGYTPNTGMLPNMDDWLVVDLQEGLDPQAAATMQAAMTGSRIGEGIITRASATAVGDALRALQSDP